MADAKKRASPPSVPPKEPIEEGKPISTTNRAKEESRTKSRPDSTSGQKESKREGQDISCSPEKRLHKTSSANTKMVDSPENGDWVEVPSRELVQESNGQGYQGQTQSALHDLMELDSPSIADKVLNDDSASQSPIMPKATLPHPAEFQSLEELAGFGNNNSTTHCNEKLREQNCQLDRRIQDLQRQLSTLTTDKQIAEEKSDTLSEKLNSLKQRMNSNMTEVEISSEALADKVEELGKENRALREQLNDAQSHIFSLQPYRKELTSEEVGQEYDDLVEQVQDWVQKFMDPWLDDHREGVDALLSNAKRRAVDATRFKHLLYQYPDLIHGASFPETDEDIITSVIMRYLHDHIFQTVLYGMIARYVEVISFIEKEMQMSVEPKRGMFTLINKIHLPCLKTRLTRTKIFSR
jgi:predicted nuclease with TOPRIM domain